MSNPSSKESRFGIALPRLESDAVTRLLGMVGLATGDVPGKSDGKVVIRFFRGWPEENLVHGLLAPDFADGYQRLVHGWSIRTTENGLGPERLSNGLSIIYRYLDGEIRIDPVVEGGQGVRSDQLRTAHHAITEFADYASEDPKPQYFDEGAYLVAENLPDVVLRGAAICMLDQVESRGSHPLAA